MKRLAYLIKNRAPRLFRAIERVGRTVTALRFGQRRHQALANARIEVTVDGRPAEIRPMEVGEAALLTDFLAQMREQRLRFSCPSGGHSHKAAKNPATFRACGSVWLYNGRTSDATLMDRGWFRLAK